MSAVETVFIDTNVFLRTLTREDEQSFAECRHFLASVKTGRFKAYTSPLVLAEINWVLAKHYGQDKAVVITALRSIRQLHHLKLDHQTDIDDALTLYEQHTVKFIDCLLATQHVVAKKRAVIVSYDTDFDRLGIPRKTPGQLA